MAANAESLPQTSGAPKRRLRNFLLDSRFQLKYTGMVVAVTVVVAGFLGYVAYRHSVDLTQAVTAAEMINAMTPEAQELLISESEAQDRKVLMGIVGGILLLALALGLTGIVVTHKVVGPAYKIRRIFGEIADGKLKVQSRLRKGDELKDVFDAFESMIETLRARQAAEVAQLDAAIEKVRAAGASEEVIAEIAAVRDQMQAELE